LDDTWPDPDVILVGEFEALGVSLTSDRTDCVQDWALSTLKEAINKGLDVSPAVPGLRHLIARHGAESDLVRGYRGIGAAEILVRLRT